MEDFKVIIEGFCFVGLGFADLNANLKKMTYIHISF